MALLENSTTRLPISKPLTFKVMRKAPVTFAPPSVREASGSTLDPIDARNGATAKVQYEGMVDTDSIILNWVGLGANDSWQSEPEKGNAALGYVDFIVPVNVVAASQGKSIEVQYAVARDNQPGIPSLALTLKVGTLAQAYLPTPSVPEATGTVLDLNEFERDATVLIDAWPLIAIGQRYWITIAGKLESGAPYQIKVSDGVSVVQADLTGLSKAILRTELEKLQDGSELTLSASIAFDPANSLEGATPLRPTYLQLRKVGLPLLAPTIGGSPKWFVDGTFYYHENASITMPAQSHIKQGDRVRGVTGNLTTAEQTVPSDGASITILIPEHQMKNLSGSGSLTWKYQVFKNQQWIDSPTAPIIVRLYPLAKQNENFDGMQIGDLPLHQTLKTPHNFELTLQRSDLLNGAATSIYLSQGKPRLFIVGDSEVKVQFPGLTNVGPWIDYGYVHNNPNHRITLYDVNDRIIETRNLEHSGDHANELRFSQNTPLAHYMIIRGARGENGGTDNDAGFLIYTIILD